MEAYKRRCALYTVTRGVKLAVMAFVGFLGYSSISYIFYARSKPLNTPFDTERAVWLFAVAGYGLLASGGGVAGGLVLILAGAARLRGRNGKQSVIPTPHSETLASGDYRKCAATEYRALRQSCPPESPRTCPDTKEAAGERR